MQLISGSPTQSQGSANLGRSEDSSKYFFSSKVYLKEPSFFFHFFTIVRRFQLKVFVPRTQVTQKFACFRKLIQYFVFFCGELYGKLCESERNTREISHSSKVLCRTIRKDKFTPKTFTVIRKKIEFLRKSAQSLSKNNSHQILQVAKKGEGAGILILFLGQIFTKSDLKSVGKSYICALASLDFFQNETI